MASIFPDLFMRLAKPVNCRAPDVALQWELPPILCLVLVWMLPQPDVKPPIDTARIAIDSCSRFRSYGALFKLPFYCRLGQVPTDEHQDSLWFFALCPFGAGRCADNCMHRSEERRVGKECRSR